MRVLLSKRVRICTRKCKTVRQVTPALGCRYHVEFLYEISVLYCSKILIIKKKKLSVGDFLDAQ